MTTPYSLDLKAAAKHVSLGRDTLLAAINRGELIAHRSKENEDGDPVGKYVVRVADLEAWVDKLPAA